METKNCKMPMTPTKLDQQFECNAPIDVASVAREICANCGVEKGFGHSKSDCAGLPGYHIEADPETGSIKNAKNVQEVIYVQVNAPGPFCRNGHRHLSS